MAAAPRLVLDLRFHQRAACQRRWAGLQLPPPVLHSPPKTAVAVQLELLLVREAMAPALSVPQVPLPLVMMPPPYKRRQSPSSAWAGTTGAARQPRPQPPRQALEGRCQHSRRLRRGCRLLHLACGCTCYCTGCAGGAAGVCTQAAVTNAGGRASDSCCMCRQLGCARRPLLRQACGSSICWRHKATGRPGVSSLHSARHSGRRGHASRWHGVAAEACGCCAMLVPPLAGNGQ